MKLFETPDIKVTMLGVEDVITSSVMDESPAEPEPEFGG